MNKTFGSLHNKDDVSTKQLEELKTNLEEHVQDGGAHELEERLEQLRETVEEHVEDGSAHQFEEQLEKLKETMEEQHQELREKMGRQVCTCLSYLHVLAGVKICCVISTSF